MAVDLDPVPTGTLAGADGNGTPALIRWMNAVKDACGRAVAIAGDTMTGALGIGVTPTYAALEVDGGTLGSTAGDTSFPLACQWNNGTNLSYFTTYAYRLSNGSSAATEAVFFKYVPAGNYEAYFGFYPSSVSIGAYAYDTLGVSTTGTVSSDDGATLQLVPAASAVLEARSTTRGFLLPRMTTTQRNNISSPSAGLMIYNTTSTKLEYWDSVAWRQVISI